MSLFSVSALSTSTLSESAVNVDLDATLFLQLALFVVLLLVLKPLLFDPMLRLFEERENRIERTIQKGRKLDDASSKALAKYEGILAKGRQEGAAERDQVRAEGVKREAEILGRVRAETAATVDQGRSALSREADRARQELAAQVHALGRAIASKVLGREVSS
jgi:F-type H+-transporting ATPase subunit b